MTVNELVAAGNFIPIVISDGEREVSGVYIGDLLSWVMGRADSGNVWITIMSNINIIAVASLADVSCIVIAEGVVLEEDVINTANAKGINILSAKESIYEIALKLGSIL